MGVQYNTSISSNRSPMAPMAYIHTQRPEVRRRQRHTMASEEADVRPSKPKRKKNQVRTRETVVTD
jgi:hypothetical protein